MSHVGLFKRGPDSRTAPRSPKKAHRLDCCDAPFTSETGHSQPSLPAPAHADCPLCLCQLKAHAQQPVMPVIGFLSSAAFNAYGEGVPAFRRGLNETGFIEGQNVAIEYRSAEGQYDRLPALASDLVGRKVSVLATAGGIPPALAAKAATTTLPIVFVMGSDPVKAGVVASLNRPEGNVTGISFLINSLGTKRVELISQLVPRASTIGMLANPNNPDA